MQDKKVDFNVLFARGVVEQDYLEFLKNVFKEYNVVPHVMNSKGGLPSIIHLILFTGGEDVSPKLYKENQGKYTRCNTSRDQTEQDIFHRIYYAVPKLGICRGAQFLTVMAGGKLIQHVTGHNSSRDRIYYQGAVLDIPSDHHQMMFPFNLKKEKYRILGHSLYFKSNTYLNGDNEEIELPKNFLEPEIVFYEEYNSLCIQSHPEWISDTSDVSFKYISNLIRSKTFKNKEELVEI